MSNLPSPQFIETIRKTKNKMKIDFPKTDDGISEELNALLKEGALQHYVKTNKLCIYAAKVALVDILNDRKTGKIF